MSLVREGQQITDGWFRSPLRDLSGAPPCCCFMCLSKTGTHSFLTWGSEIEKEHDRLCPREREKAKSLCSAMPNTNGWFPHHLWLCALACLLVCSCVLLLASSCLKRTGANPFTETPLKGLNSTQGSDAANLIRVCVRDSDHTMLRQASVNV